MKKLIYPILIIIFFTIACKKLLYIADENAVIYIEAIPTIITPGDTAKIIVTGEKGNGYPVPDGTIVYLSASVGSVNREVNLIDGSGEALYQSDADFSGEITITARCGKALISPDQLIITAAKIDISYLFINADPVVLPYGGGTSTITIKAMDENMKPVKGKILWIGTTSGSLQGGGEYVTDDNGKVVTLLTTDQAATVTVRYGDIEQSVDIIIEYANIPPTADFIYSPTAPKSGEAIYFNAGASGDSDGKIVSFRWDFGDGTSARGETVYHTYTVTAATTFVVTLKVVDDSGDKGVVSKEITVSI